MLTLLLNCCINAGQNTSVIWFSFPHLWKGVIWMELLPFTLFGSSSCLKVDGEGFIKDNPLDLSLELCLRVYQQRRIVALLREKTEYPRLSVWCEWRMIVYFYACGANEECSPLYMWREWRIVVLYVWCEWRMLTSLRGVLGEWWEAKYVGKIRMRCEERRSYKGSSLAPVVKCLGCSNKKFKFNPIGRKSTKIFNL